MFKNTFKKRQEARARGKRQEARGKRQEARGKRQGARDLLQNGFVYCDQILALGTILHQLILQLKNHNNHNPFPVKVDVHVLNMQYSFTTFFKLTES